MATIQDEKIKNDENIPLTVDKKWKKRPWSDAEFLRQLRQGRERRYFQSRMEYFYGPPLTLKADLPLPEYEAKFSHHLYRVEHLHDVCNKATVIYDTNSNTWGLPLYEYIFGQFLFLSLLCLPRQLNISGRTTFIMRASFCARTSSRALSLRRRLLILLIEMWSHGDLHTTDIEFGRLFAKFIKTSRSDGERPTTQDVLKLHTALLDAAVAEKAKGFAKEDPAEERFPGIRDFCFKAKHQIEYFNIKPLCRALIMIIENPQQRNSHFEQQLVRLVRTGETAGLSQPVSFQGLEVQKVLTEDEVVVLLPEAVRFIMDLDEKEEALQVR